MPRKMLKKMSKKHSVHKRRHRKGAGFFDEVGNLTKSATQKLVSAVKQIQEIAPTVIAVAKFAKDLPGYVETAAEFVAPYAEAAAEVAPMLALGKKHKKHSKKAGNYEIGGKKHSKKQSKKQSKKHSKKKRHVSAETLKILAMGRAKRAANLAKRKH